jgi:hypothetical protein
MDAVNSPSWRPEGKIGDATIVDQITRQLNHKEWGDKLTRPMADDA